MRPSADFDSLARPYRRLERLAFGGALETARFCHLEALRRCRRALVLGEGDGRFLARLLRRVPEARVDCVDASAAMLARAAGRLGAEDRARVNFIHADARRWALAAGVYDTAATLFFFDCFEQAEAEELTARIAAALRPDALWLWADFAVPPRGWRRARARLWLALLYAFFRWRTGLVARRLPEIEGALRVAGFEPGRTTELQAGLLRACLWRRGGR